MSVLSMLNSYEKDLQGSVVMKQLLIIMLFLVGLVGIVQAADVPVWVEAVGESVGSEYDPPKEVMERARNEAMRKAVEEAVGIFIRSHTLVTNAQLAEEMTFARVRGKIDKVRIISEERDSSDPNLYRVKLRALVRPTYPEEGEAIGVKLSLSRSTLKEGDDVRIYYQANTDCYIYIFSIGADNSVTLLFPNSRMQDNFVKANNGQVFPPENCPIHLQAMCLPGISDKVSREKVKIIATRRKEIILRGFQEGIFKVYDSKSTGLVGDLARKLNQIDPADWGEALALYTVEK